MSTETTKTVAQAAAEVGVSKETYYRWIKSRKVEHPDPAKRTVPLEKTARIEPPGGDIPPAPLPTPAPKSEKRPAPAPVPACAPPPVDPRRDATEFFRSRKLAVFASMIIICSDALCFAWIAYNTYSKFSLIAAIIFAPVGFAVGYSAIKNIVTYRGWNSDGWAWGFALFQILLHSCAMESLGQYSFPAGKVTMAVGITLSTAGLAVSMKTENKAL